MMPSLKAMPLLAKIGVNMIRYHAIIAPKGPNSKIDEVDTVEVRNIMESRCCV
jgi:hypothetical protein